MGSVDGPADTRSTARRLKVGFETDAARNLYLGAGFVQTSIDRLLIGSTARTVRAVTRWNRDHDHSCGPR